MAAAAVASAIRTPWLRGRCRPLPPRPSWAPLARAAWERPADAACLPRRRASASGRPGVCECRQLLGLEHGAGEPELRSAYRALARKLHPDRGGRREQFQELQQCYEMLLAEARGGSIGGQKPDWLEKMKEDFAHYSCC
uniref:J domain-containing protein n=1 Tax=Alexandrium monilatum TaxID=311494 RepID=A0A7S4UVE9_9DINO